MSFDVTMNQFVVFMLVLTRISGLVAVAPILGSRSVPVQIRAFVALALSVIVTPMYVSTSSADPENVVRLMVMFSGEFFVGFSIGYAINLLFQSAQVAGQIIGQMSGMQLADVFNPNLGTSMPLFGQLIDLIMLAIFVTIGGVSRLLTSLLHTFEVMPPGAGYFSKSFHDLLIQLLGESFTMGLRIGAPMMVSLLLSIMIMGLISRTLPQLNVIQVGFSFNSLVMLFMLASTIGVASNLFDSHVLDVFQSIDDALLSSASK